MFIRGVNDIFLHFSKALALDRRCFTSEEFPKNDEIIKEYEANAEKDVKQYALFVQPTDSVKAPEKVIESKLAEEISTGVELGKADLCMQIVIAARDFYEDTMEAYRKVIFVSGMFIKLQILRNIISNSRTVFLLRTRW